MLPAVDWPSLHEEIAELGELVAEMLRDAPDPTRSVRGSEWTVAELGAHLVDVARRNVGFSRHPQPSPLPDEGGLHDGMASTNERRLREDVTERDPDKLAAMLVAENENVLEAYGPDGERTVFWYDVEMTERSLAGVWLGELLVHGLDLARTVGRPWPISADQATAVFEGLAPAFPRAVDRDVARSVPGVYHLRLRGEGDHTFEVGDDGSLRVEAGTPERADVHVSADPVAFLLVGYGRAGRWGAILRGRIVAWGRKPWLALRFADLLERP